MPYEAFLVSEAKRVLGPPQVIAHCHWFHLTRVPLDADFSDGLLPLGQVIDRVWDAVGATLPAAERVRLDDLRARGHHGGHYTLKVPDQHHWGPYAMLVRETAFYPQQLSHVDYLELPEIIEDICNDYAQAYGASILSTVKQGLHPCIVEFTDRSSSSPLGAALAYVVAKARDEPVSAAAVHCFDAGGRRIDKRQIVSVEFDPKP